MTPRRTYLPSIVLRLRYRVCARKCKPLLPDKACLVSCFGTECLDFEQSSYIQSPGNKAGSSPTGLYIPNQTMS